MAFLRNTSSWDDWFFLIRTFAQGKGVWHLCDPDLPARPSARSKPATPVRHPEFTVQVVQLLLLYAETEKYRQEKEAMLGVTMRILESIPRDLFSALRQVEPHPWDFLRVLRRAMAPQD